MPVGFQEIRTLFGAVKSMWDAGRDILFPSVVEVNTAHTTGSPLNMDSVTENPVSQKPITFHGEYTRTYNAFNRLRNWSTTSTKSSGMFNPKIAAVVALGIGLSTAGWGSALAGSMGLTGASAAALQAGVSAVCTQVGVDTLQNNGDIRTTPQTLTRTRNLVHVLESMATAGVTAGVTGGLSGVSAHVARAGIREGVHTGFGAAQGEFVRGADILKRGVVNAASGIAAEHIGKAYSDASIDPILHKLLHGGIGGIAGGILGSKDGAISGASAAVIAETLGDLMRPQVEAALTAIAVNADSAESYHTQAEEYLNTQHNLLLLTSVAITTALGGDVDMATYAADNALSHNAMKTLLKIAQKIGEKVAKETVKTATKDGVKTAVKTSAKKAVKDTTKTAEKQGVSKGAQTESVSSRIKSAQLPKKGKIRYIPPKGYKPSKPLPKGPNHGYIDKFGNEWTKGPSRTAKESFEWDVQLSRVGKDKMNWISRDGQHLNVSLNGRITHK